MSYYDYIVSRRLFSNAHLHIQYIVKGRKEYQ
jgi:hypothetical protein